jgi:hypothetical protein
VEVRGVEPGGADILDLLSSLARRRPVFHSEADFQHQLAWEAHMADPTMEVRLETRPRRGIRLDLLFSRPERGLFTAIEVKYLTARLSSTVAGEEFVLPISSRSLMTVRTPAQEIRKRVLDRKCPAPGTYVMSWDIVDRCVGTS